MTDEHEDIKRRLRRQPHPGSNLSGLHGASNLSGLQGRSIQDAGLELSSLIKS